MTRKISEPKQEELTRKLKKLQAEALYDLYASPNIMRVNTSWRMGMGSACGRYGGNEFNTKV
jgi:glycosylphosphatidylinositol transamidase (GPIT) subunit GPI8